MRNYRIIRRIFKIFGIILLNLIMFISGFLLCVYYYHGVAEEAYKQGFYKCADQCKKYCEKELRKRFIKTNKI